MSGAIHLTYSAIGLAVFGQQLCLPLPSMLLLMTAGALADRGEGSLTIPLVLLSSVIACVAADSVWFWLGRRWGSNVIRLICSLTSDPQGSRERSRRAFDQWGLRLLLVSKFVPLMDGVSPPLAGAQGATIRGFLAYDTVGSLLWSAAYVLLGFIFASELDRVITSARVAQALKRVGVTNVCILEGGLNAWIAEGHPTTTNFKTKEELAVRLGVVLPPAPVRRRFLRSH